MADSSHRRGSWDALDRFIFSDIPADTMYEWKGGRHGRSLFGSHRTTPMATRLDRQDVDHPATGPAQKLIPRVDGTIAADSGRPVLKASCSIARTTVVHIRAATLLRTCQSASEGAGKIGFNGHLNPTNVPNDHPTQTGLASQTRSALRTTGEASARL